MATNRPGNSDDVHTAHPSWWTDLDTKAVDTARLLAADAVQKAGSGHPGTAMSLAPLAYLLYTRVMKHNPADADWFDRDRFILSAGHASMLLYSSLYLAGYGLTLEDLENFRQLDSPTAGHPERGDAAGIEAMIRSDDTGGQRPHLAFVRGVELVVRAEDAEAATQILDASPDEG